MKKILIVFDCSNGYTCSCCGQWWEESDVFEIEDDVDPIEFIKNRREECYANKDYGRKDIESAYIVSEQIC